MIEQLERFMEGRPHDKEKNIVDAAMEYIEQVEKVSIDRYEALNQ